MAEEEVYLEGPTYRIEGWRPMYVKAGAGCITIPN